VVEFLNFLWNPIPKEFYHPAWNLGFDFRTNFSVFLENIGRKIPFTGNSRAPIVRPSFSYNSHTTPIRIP